MNQEKQEKKKVVKQTENKKKQKKGGSVFFTKMEIFLLLIVSFMFLSSIFIFVNYPIIKKTTTPQNETLNNKLNNDLILLNNDLNSIKTDIENLKNRQNTILENTKKLGELSLLIDNLKEKTEKNQHDLSTIAQNLLSLKNSQQNKKEPQKISLKKATEEKVIELDKKKYEGRPVNQKLNKEKE